jgi:hypothetical protein
MINIVFTLIVDMTYPVGKQVIETMKIMITAKVKVTTVEEQKNQSYVFIV